ncbi:hypothetical protein SAMN03159341_10774 [Paenibacillus sp. 1_12]|uniref:hypothetical protein n=1 Tax=Paenibacillus sp. 1_12 TaxID=1566278 RepID=UPI0008F1B453|nr:hypothetical protein [Paenibacillus sp. 1_12]SFL54484.1 hypothetical protein SAMN03159341_10774 [Paenibacillus sp. 1_12]
MTLFYYIASDKKLPTGSFGKKKTIMKLKDALELHPPQANSLPATIELTHLYEQNTEVYETEEDAAGLYISGPLTNQDTSRHFRHPFVYQVDHDGGSFSISKRNQEIRPQSYLLGKKCLTELFTYLNRILESGEDAELFACWAHGIERFEEPRNSKLDLVLDLNIFELGDEFEWQERQYIVVKK